MNKRFFIQPLSYCFIALMIICATGTLIAQSPQHPFDHDGIITVKGKPMFTYTARYKLHDGQMVIATDCFDISGKPIAKEHTTYKVHPLQLIESKTEDLRSGRIEHIAFNASNYAVKFRKNGKASLKDRIVESEDDIIPNSLLLPYILQNWDDVVRGEAKSVQLLLADQPITVGFKFTVIGEEIVNGLPCVIIKAAPASFIIRQFADPIFLAFERSAPHRLMQYRGVLASIKSDDGGNIDAVTMTKYGK